MFNRWVLIDPLYSYNVGATAWLLSLKPYTVNMLCDDLVEADNRVAKSNGSDVGGTWLQLICCALPKHLCP